MLLLSDVPSRRFDVAMSHQDRSHLQVKTPEAFCCMPRLPPRLAGIMDCHACGAAAWRPQYQSKEYLRRRGFLVNHAYIYMYTCVFISISIFHVHIHIMYMHMYMYIYTYTYARVYVFISACLHLAYKYVYLCMYTHRNPALGPSGYERST